MKRILVIGSNGAGKSTFAKKLHETLILPLIHLDQYYWKPGWIRPETSKWMRIVEDLAKKQEWIMDGNYSNSLNMRISYADTIILLDYPRLVCFWRVLKRRFKKNRRDCIMGCEERLDWEFLIWILWKFPQINRKQILEILKSVRNDKKIYILKSDEDIEKFINQISI